MCDFVVCDFVIVMWDFVLGFCHVAFLSWGFYRV